MKKRLQKKHHKLVRENKLMKGTLGQELRKELSRLPYLNQQDIACMKEDVTNLYSQNRSRYQQIMQQEEKLQRTRQAVEQIRYELDKMTYKLTMTCALVVVCTISWAIMLF